MKKIWISLLSKNEEKAKKMMGSLGQYGLAPAGHFWSNNLEKMEWSSARQPLLDPEVALWMIVANETDFADPDTRFGLSLLSLTVQAARGHGFPTVIVFDGKQPTLDSLPTPLRHAQFAPDSAALGAKVVARVNVPFKPQAAEYRLDVYGVPGLGLWLEAGPAAGHNWNGAMFGVSPGDINAHGVAAAGKLPTEKMILNYPMQGLKLKLGEREYTAWAVKNPLDEKTSYYLRVLERPESFVFGEFSESDSAEVFVLKMI